VNSCGAGIFNAETGTLTMNDCTITGDSITLGDGGGLYNAGQVIMHTNTFSYDTAGYTGVLNVNDGTGGAIKNGESGSISGYDVTIVHNYGGDGGGIFNGGGTLSFTNGSLSYNHTDQDGGGIKGDGMCSFTDVEVYYNTALADGGGLTCGNPDADLDLQNDTLKGNRAGYDGGGIRDVGTTTATDCLIVDNKAGGNGGGIDSDVSNSFGASYALQLNGDTITANTAGDGAAGNGGGIYSYCNEGYGLYAKNCAISGDTAYGSGGGICIDNGFESDSLAACTISGDDAIGGSGGGFDQIGYNDRELTATDCTFANDTASANGGGLCLKTRYVDIRDSTISGDQAVGGDGGGVYDGESGGTHTFINCTIAEDSTSSTGGG
jgi:hypothetical protein